MKSLYTTCSLFTATFFVLFIINGKETNLASEAAIDYPAKGSHALLAFPPNQPVNPAPANGSTTVTLSPNMCVAVSDPDGGNLRVRFYGRKKPAGNSGKFTFIMLPDTQYYTEQPQENHDGANTSMFNAETAWIAANRASKNIVYVGHLGDCVQNGDNPPGSNNSIEWQRVVTAMAAIESPAQTGLPEGIPFGMCVGNHDQTPIGTAAGTTMYYNQYFGSNHFMGRSYYGGHNGSNNDNHYQLFSASGIDFLVISFEYDELAGFSAPGGALDWAEGLVQTFNTRKVIVMTHYGINENQSFGTQGQAIYNRLKVYPNFSLFFCGHVHTTDGEARRTDVFNGNTVHTMLSDYQETAGGGNGQLRIYELDPQLNTLSAKTYSPFTDAYQTDGDSQFSLPVNLGAYSLIGEVSNAPSGTNACVSWPNLIELTEYEWYAEVFDGQNTTFGPLWTFTTAPNPPLPVHIVSFTATPEIKRVQLNWRTATEQNNHHFNIERSLNGTDFIKIGMIAGNGTASTPHNYIFYDNMPVKGWSWYRLQQVDNDTHFKYSNSVIVKYTGKERFEISPNPVTGTHMNIFFFEKIKGEVKIILHDMNGHEMYNRSYHDPMGTIKLPMNLPAGTYMLAIAGADINSEQKVVILR